MHRFGQWSIIPQMRPYKFYWNKLPLGNIIYASFGICIFLLLMVATLQKFLPPQVPLLYGEAVGENQLVGSWGLLLAPAFALTVLFINTRAASKADDDFTKKALIVSSFFISILTLITLV